MSHHHTHMSGIVAAVCLHRLDPIRDSFLDARDTYMDPSVDACLVQGRKGREGGREGASEREREEEREEGGRVGETGGEEGGGGREGSPLVGGRGERERDGWRGKSGTGAWHPPLKMLRSQTESTAGWRGRQAEGAQCYTQRRRTRMLHLHRSTCSAGRAAPTP